MTIIPEITVDEIDPQGVLLDVRESDEWAAGHAPGARHLALSELAEADHGFDAGQRVQVVCKVGGRSARAAAFLRDQGIDAVNVVGGMLAWAAAGLDVVTDDGTTGRIA